MPSPKDCRASNNYRKPPVDYQFKKGESGNPKGRPKKKANQPGVGALGGGIADRLSTMALDEATRPITVREGDKVSEIPAMQALFRTMFRAAAQGDTKAARQLLDVVARAESGRTNLAVEILQHAAQYKERYLPVFEKHEREGLDPPDIYPHPDDMLINEDTGEVTIDGPVSAEQAGARKAVREEAFREMPRYFELERALAQDPKNRELRKEFKELQKYYDFLQKDFERNTRHRALQLSRRALEPKSPEHDENSDEPDGQGENSDKSDG
jgi:hypothetical protein